MDDLYKRLGLERTASADEIQRAYRKLVAQYHPDKHQDNALRALAEEKIRSINEAYEVLSDPTARARYDRGEQPSFVGGRQQKTMSPQTKQFERFLKWAVIVIGTPLAIRFIRNPKVSVAILVVAGVWFLSARLRKRS